MTAQRPNILFIQVDQLAGAFAPGFGNPIVKAPNLARLAAEGVVFENAYCPSPLCAPSRAAMMAGMLPSKTRVYDNAAEFASAIPTMPHYLRREGYRTCLSGKMHFVGPDQLHGFEERLTTDIYPADFGWTPDWTKPQERIDWWYHNLTSVKQAGIAHVTNQIDYDEEVAFLANRRLYDYARRSVEPFFLLASFTHPHDPYAAKPKHWNLYKTADIDMPAVAPVAYDRLDPHSRRLYDMSALGDYDVTAEDIRSSRHGYYANISYLDDKVGEMLATLEAGGLLDRTLIVFTSDHGDFLGERGLWYKMSFLDPSARVPLLVWQPKRFKPRRVTEPVSLLDLLPTLVEIGQGDGPARLVADHDGRSLVPLLEGGRESETSFTRAEYLAEGAVSPMLMLRRGTFKYIWTEPDPVQLHDLATDPNELANLADDPAHAEVLAAFEAERRRSFDSRRINAEVLASQRTRLMLFPVLKQGAYFPWDYQPLQRASEQYTRNHLDDVTATDQLSRLPRAVEPRKKSKA